MKIQLLPSDPHTGLEVLEEDTCWRLLAEHMYGVGRIAFVEDSRPTILPVNYALVGKRIVMRTGSGSKLDAALHGADVAFEVDCVDQESRTGWSVMVAGPTRVMSSPWDEFELRTCPLRPWTPIEGERWIAIQPEKVTGRRITTHWPPNWLAHGEGELS